MTMYLNQSNDSFIRDRNNPIYVDKSLIIKETNANFNTGSGRFMCVTRPRRFGKTMALNMLNAYYSKGSDSKELFKDLKIAGDPSFPSHLNKHNVLWVDMAGIYTDTADKSDFVDELRHEIIDALDDAYPGILGEKENTARKAFARVAEETGESFVFLIDEWDVVYREQGRNRKLCDAYTEFLRSIFKSSDASRCFDLVYMTGILPIRRYNTQSALNMFTEYNMLEPRNIANLFGFTESEVKSLCSEHGRDFSEIKKWYDGYRLGGLDVYNPKSVVEAITLGRCGDYWVATSSVEAVARYMNFDGGALKGEIVEMLNGGEAGVNPGMFENDLAEVKSKDAALTVLVHLGYLAYLPPEIPGEKGSCYIPNKEISLEFEKALEKLNWHDLYDPISNSMKLYEETFKGNTEFIDETLDRNHKDLASPISKNDEKVLALVVATSYYRVRDFYFVNQESTEINGRSDVSFYPTKPGHVPFIIELKVGYSPEEAIAQIKKKAYWEQWSGYKGEVLLVGINYDAETLKHTSKIEWIEV